MLPKRTILLAAGLLFGNLFPYLLGYQAFTHLAWICLVLLFLRDYKENIPCVLEKNASLPKRAKPGDAGLDLCSSEDITVPTRGSVLVSTGIHMAIPTGFYGRISSRSGLAVKNGIEVGAGTIDSGYRDTIRILLRNHSDEDYQIRVGDRIAQIVITSISTIDCESVKDLPPSDRGFGGFGSTGR